MRRFAAGIALTACALTACAHHPDDAFVSAAAHLRPSVVLITMEVPSENARGGSANEYATGTIVASGAWGSDVLTVEHATEGASNLRVTVANKHRDPGRVIARNPDVDVALVRITRPNLPVARLGTSADAQPGRDIGLLGYPIPDQFEEEGLGLATSLIAGHISAIREDTLEISLPIVPGESGGPVFLSDGGEVIGMAQSRFQTERSIGFAMPIDEAKRFLHKADAAHGL